MDSGWGLLLEVTVVPSEASRSTGGISVVTAKMGTLEPSDTGDAFASPLPGSK